jgi:hypothetical protein
MTRRAASTKAVVPVGESDHPLGPSYEAFPDRLHLLLGTATRRP